MKAVRPERSTRPRPRARVMMPGSALRPATASGSPFTRTSTVNPAASSAAATSRVCSRALVAASRLDPPAARGPGLGRHPLRPGGPGEQRPDRGEVGDLGEVHADRVAEPLHGDAAQRAVHPQPAAHPREEGREARERSLSGSSPAGGRRASEAQEEGLPGWSPWEVVIESVPSSTHFAWLCPSPALLGTCTVRFSKA